MVAAVASILFAAAVVAQASRQRRDMETAPPGMFPSTGQRDLTGAYTNAKRAGSAGDGAGQTL
jgi:hypothetical protein